jgi:hypothetical protein
VRVEPRGHLGEGQDVEASLLFRELEDQRLVECAPALRAAIGVGGGPASRFRMELAGQQTRRWVASDQ